MTIVKNTRTDMSLTGVDPALGNSRAVAPTTTIVETMALSARVRPHGGTVATATAKNNLALSPALVETYSRLLVYTEIESLGIKGFVSQVLPKISSYQV